MKKYSKHFGVVSAMSLSYLEGIQFIFLAMCHDHIFSGRLLYV
jgi:hypothetical protein